MKVFLSLMGIEITQYKIITHTFDSLVDGYHLDVMDGLFVPSKNIPIDTSFNAIKKLSIKPLWIHFMTMQPLNQLATLGQLDGTTVSFHIEINNKIDDIIFSIKEKSGRPSLAICPKTSIPMLEPFLNTIDHVTVMSVNPGASGQKFIPESIMRIKKLAKLFNAHDHNITIACDGGVDETNIAILKSNGITAVALSNAIFKHKTAQEQIKAFELIRTQI